MEKQRGTQANTHRSCNSKQNPFTSGELEKHFICPYLLVLRLGKVLITVKFRKNPNKIANCFHDGHYGFSWGCGGQCFLDLRKINILS